MNQLAAFVAVAEAGTISAAAEKLHSSPSALSAAVTELERALQAQLLRRRKAKGVSLTPPGEAVLSRARALLHQASELEADARGEERGVSGLVRLGCYPSLAPTVLPALISDFTGTHPDARLEVHENTQDQLSSGLDSGELDLAIVYDIDLDPSWRSAPPAQLAPRLRVPRPRGIEPEPALPGPPLRAGARLRRPQPRLDAAAPAPERLGALRGPAGGAQGRRPAALAARSRRGGLAAGLAAQPRVAGLHQPRRPDGRRWHPRTTPEKLR